MLGLQEGLAMSCAVCAGHDTYNCPCCGDDVRMVECPDCGGTGMTPYKAFNIQSRKEVPVTRLTWLLIPKDEDEAESKGKRYCRAYRDICRTCGGLGEIQDI